MPSPTIGTHISQACDVVPNFLLEIRLDGHVGEVGGNGCNGLVGQVAYASTGKDVMSREDACRMLHADATEGLQCFLSRGSIACEDLGKRKVPNLDESALDVVVP